MPWKSKAQARWGHSPAGIKALGGKKKVSEWDKASEGMKMPERSDSKHFKNFVKKHRQ